MKWLIEKLRNLFGPNPEQECTECHAEQSEVPSPAPQIVPVASEPEDHTFVSMTDMTKAELLQLAKDLGVTGVNSKSKKQDIIKAIQEL